MPTIKEIETWYEKALEVSEQERSSFLEMSLSDRPDLLNAVLELFENNDTQEEFLNRLRFQMDRTFEKMDDQFPEMERYAILEEVGRGGMAVIYRAKRTDGEFDHEVAIKVLKRGMDTDEIVDRFRRERNVLASLQHENIARIYDGAVTKDGRPYFVMELVDGDDLINFADNNQLQLNERLSLFRKVCNAVRFAHQNLVIHRDIKPSNILINERGEVKLTDFGIAKIMDTSDVEATMPEKMMFTPRYASPEQKARKMPDVRSDIYQLGLVLADLMEGVKIPSDLDKIIKQATMEEPEHRYSSVEALDEDIGRFLENRPVSARRPDAMYRLGKYVQRNKLAVLSTAAIFLVVIISTALFIRNIQESNRRLTLERRIAKSSSNLLLRIFSQSYPSYARGDTVTIFELMHYGDSIVRLSDSTNVTNGRFLRLLGEIYAGYNRPELALGYYQDALTYFDRERDIPDLAYAVSPGIFTSAIGAAQNYITLGALDSAYRMIEIARKELPTLKDNFEENDRELGRVLSSLAWIEVNRGNYDRADSLYQRSLFYFDKEIFPLETANRLGYYGRFLTFYDPDGRKMLIDSMFRVSLKLLKSYGFDTLREDDYARNLNFYGIFQLSHSEYEKARRNFEEAREINVCLFGEKSISVLDNTNNLARISLIEKEYVAARNNFAFCWNTASELNIPLQNRLIYYYNYATTFNLNGDYEMARFKLDSLTRVRNDLLPNDHISNSACRYQLAIALEKSNQPQKAALLYERVISDMHQHARGKNDLDLRAAVRLANIDRYDNLDSLRQVISAREGSESELIDYLADNSQDLPVF